MAAEIKFLSWNWRFSTLNLIHMDKKNKNKNKKYEKYDSLTERKSNWKMKQEF